MVKHSEGCVAGERANTEAAGRGSLGTGARLPPEFSFLEWMLDRGPQYSAPHQSQLRKVRKPLFRFPVLFTAFSVLPVRVFLTQEQVESELTD